MQYYSSIAPSKSLQKYVDSYFLIDCNYIQKEVVDLILPDTTFGILFNPSSADFTRKVLTESLDEQTLESSIFGQKVRPIKYKFKYCDAKVFGAKLTAPGMNLLFRDDMKLLNDSYFNFKQLGDKKLQDLNGSLSIMNDFSSKVSSFENYLIKEISNFDLNSVLDFKLFQSILDFINGNSFIPSIDHIHQRFNLHYKKQQRIFSRYLGISLISYLKLLRFNKAIKSIGVSRYNKLTDIGFMNGYFDQSHFIREFKAHSSLTPSQFIKRSFNYSESYHLSMINNRTNI